jgi:hypothetical protein
MALKDLRGQLPSRRAYNARPLDAITGITIHYTQGGTNQSARAIAEYQISPEAATQTGAGEPFPGIAYTILVTGDGTPNLCHDLDRRTWHSSAVVNGLARNLTNIGICYTGNSQPNEAQRAGIAEAIGWCEAQLDRRLAVEGHGDAMATDCPGPFWSQWRSEVLGQVHPVDDDHDGVDVTNGFSVGEGIRRFLEANPEWGKARMDEKSLDGGAYLWTTPTARHPLGALVVYRTFLNEVRGLAWD